MKISIIIVILTTMLYGCGDKATQRYIYCLKCKKDHSAGFMKDKEAGTDKIHLGNITSFPNCMIMSERYESNKLTNAKYERRRKAITGEEYTYEEECNHECNCNCEDLYNQLKQEIRDEHN